MFPRWQFVPPARRGRRSSMAELLGLQAVEVALGLVDRRLCVLNFPLRLRPAAVRLSFLGLGRHQCRLCVS